MTEATTRELPRPASLEESLLQSILLEPDCDDLRLILADHYEDIGETGLASFIRDQIALEKMVWASNDFFLLHNRILDNLNGDAREMAWAFFPGAADWHGLGLSQDDAKAWGEGRRWGPSLYAPSHSLEIFFRRGLPWMVSCPCQFWREHGPTLVLRAPLGFTQLLDVATHKYASGFFITNHPIGTDGSKDWPWRQEQASASSSLFQTVEALFDQLSLDALNWARGEAGLKRFPLQEA